MGWCRVPRPISLASFEFWRLANHNKTFAYDLMSNQKAHQNSEGTAGRGTKSDLLRMWPDWNRPHTRSDSPSKTWFPLPVNNADSCSRCDPLVWVRLNWTWSSAVNKQGGFAGPSFFLTTSPPYCSEWLLCIVESYWLVSPSAHPGPLRRLATAMRGAFEEWNAGKQMPLVAFCFPHHLVS